MGPTGKNRYGIRVLNISVGIGELKERYKEQMLRKSLELLWDHNILVVCAAGEMQDLRTGVFRRWPVAGKC